MSQPETGRKYPPASTCIFCDKSLDEVGGQRLTAHWSLAVFPSSKPIGGGNPKAPNRPLRISSDPPVYLILRELSSRWTPEHIAKAKALFLEGKRPWFCQVCGNRCCHECGTPMRRPVGSDVLHSDGSTSHVAILGVDVGCSNPACSKYRKLD